MRMWRHLVAIAIAVILVYTWDTSRRKITTRESIDDVYDFIIVGSGSAGSVIANRLSEISDWKVLLLEAGEDDAKFPDLYVPMRAANHWGNPDVDWMYQTEPQRHACQSMIGQRCALTRGKLLGGSSSINCMIYNRGHPEDYNYWAKHLGCDGWSYEDILPYFIKSESNQNPYLVKSGYHGDSGPMVISDSNYTTDEVWFKAATELGYKVGDMHGPDNEGVASHAQATIRNGVRWGVASAYLRPALRRPNLHLLTGAHVSKVVIEFDRATAVEFIRNGRLQRVRAAREIILSAGTIGTPQILLLSGIGPKWHLDEMHIPVQADLPVGENFQDHMMSISPQVVFSNTLAVTPETAGSFKEKIKYALWGTGQLASPCGASVTIVMPTNSQQKPKVPNIAVQGSQWLYTSNRESSDSFSRSERLRPGVLSATHGTYESHRGFHIRVFMLNSKSKGTLRLQSQNPFVYPAIDPDYLSASEDVTSFVEGIRFAQNLARTKAFRELSARITNTSHPQCRSFEYDSDFYWECYLRHMAFPLKHFAGTCRMGAIDDVTSVVDPRLRVKGLQGLRVADASIIPKIPSGGINIPVMMIAERVSDFVKEEYQGI